MTNFILLKKGLQILVVPIEKRNKYIIALKTIRKEATDEYLIRFFLETVIARMEKELADKQNMTTFQ